MVSCRGSFWVAKFIWGHRGSGCQLTGPAGIDELSIRQQFHGRNEVNQSTRVPLLDVGRANQPLRESILDALAEVVDSGRFLHGPQVVELENEVATLTQSGNAVGCASGSDALLLSLMALGIGPGDEVIVPSFTFFASVSCITRLGATPVFVDILPDTYNVDPDRIAEAITPKTKAIIAVHLFGQCAQIDRIVQIGGGRDVPVIEDAAQAIGAGYHSRPAGSWGTMGCFSFYPTKNLGGMGDGGMLTATDPAVADRLRLYANHGMRPRYHHKVVGINSRLDTFQAAVLSIKIAKLGEIIEERSRIANRYDEMLSATGLIGEAIDVPYRDPAATHVWNQYSVRVRNERRDPLRESLLESEIGTEIYYPIPVHRQECYRDLETPRHTLRQTESACNEIMHLPIFPGLTEGEQQRVVEGIESHYRRQVRAAA